MTPKRPDRSRERGRAPRFNPLSHLPRGVTPHALPPSELRAWLRYCLQNVAHPETGREWTQADVGRAAAKAIGREQGISGATVSRVFRGELPKGHLADAVRDATAKVLGVDVEQIWKRPPRCPTCGQLVPTALDE